MGPLAVVTCLFNPLGWRSRRAVFDEFAAGMIREGVPVYCVELLFAGQRSHAAKWFPETTIALGPEQHAKSVLFHKEALLNIGIRRALELGFEHIAWFDADVTFSEPGWSGRIVEAFGRGQDGLAPNVVQCFSRLLQRFTDRTLRKSSAAASFVRSGGRDVRGSMGGAWAATRAFLERHREAGPLYDKVVAIGGDAANFHAYARADLRGGGIPGLPPLLRDAPGLARHWRGWAEAFGDGVVIGCADLEITALPHGSLAERLYGEGGALLSSYSPRDDVRLNERGILEWTGSNRAVKEAVLEYFKSRREDDRPQAAVPVADLRSAAAELWRRSKSPPRETAPRAVRPGPLAAKGRPGRWRTLRRFVSSCHSVLRLLRMPKVSGRKIDFVVLSGYRSGSTYLASALDSHPSVVCHDELFNPQRSLFSVRAAPDPGLNLPQWARILFCGSFLNRVLASQAPAERTGFKVIVHTEVSGSAQFKGRLKSAIMGNERLAKIVLLRRDGLRRYLSLQVARQSRTWHTTSESREVRRVHLDIGEFLRAEARLRARYASLIRTLRRKRHPFLLAYYEDVTGPGRDAALAKALAFLGVRKRPLDSPYRRTNPFPLSEMISNYDEVKRGLRGTRYGRYL